MLVPPCGAAGVDVAYCSEEFGGPDGLEEVSAGTCGEAIENCFGVVVTGEHDDLWGADRCREKSDNLDATGVRQIDVHEDHIRIQGGN
jgi:hypothetical protein